MAGRWRFIGMYIQANLQSAMEYRASFLTQIIFMFLNNLMLLFFWWVLFSRIEQLNGWELKDILLLYAITSGSFACQALFFGGSFQLSRWIAEGQIDYFLVTPKPVLLHIVVSHAKAFAWGDLAFSFLIFVWAIQGQWVKLWWYPIFFVTGGLLMASFSVVVHSLSFWLGNSSGLANQLYEPLLTFSLYPEGIFSVTVRILLYTIIPAGFVAYLPVRLVTSFQLSYAFAIIGATALFVLFASAVFYRGLKRYESGNLVVIRL